MRHLSRLLPGAALAALILCLAAVTATAAVRSDGHGHGNDDGNANGHGNGNAPAAPAAASAAPATPPGPAKKTTAAPPAPTAQPTPPGQAKKTAAAAPTTPPGQAKKAPATTSTTTSPAPTPTTGDAQTAPGQSAAPTPVPPAAAPVIGESMGLTPAAGTVQVRLPNSTGYVSLAAAGSVPSGAVVDARRGTVLLRTAVDASGRTQTATLRGAIFEVRQSADGKGMTDLILRDGPPKDCHASAAMARAAMAPGTTTEAKPGSSGLWAHDRHGRFRTRGRNSVATVRGTRWVTRETCAGTLTRVMEGAVDVFDKHTHRTVRVRAGNSYLARTSG